MKLLKSLTELKSNGSNHETKINAFDHFDDSANEKLTYFQSGFGDSKNALGNPAILKSCLENVYQGFKERCRKDKLAQAKLNEPFIEERESQKTELLKRETAISIKEAQLEKCENEIRDIEGIISQVKVQPEKYGVEASSKPKAHFFIGLFVLVPITLYLLVFYISASYSAFFKNFESIELQSAIFDAQAFNKALKDGWLEAVFVSTIPFAFMGLGYLIHMFLKEKVWGKVKVGGLLVITFVFDSILAYLIESKIYQIERTLMSEDFDLKIAFSRIEFWGIIFAGFVVYIIWGLVFDFIMKEHENYDKIKLFINNQNESKLNLKKQANAISLVIEKIKEEMTSIIGRIQEIQSKIDGFIFPNRTYLLYHSEYIKGWLLAINKEIALPIAENQKLIEDCQSVAEKHLSNHDIINENNENIIYLNRAGNEK